MFTENDIISTYTTDQAIEDGQLVHAYPERFPFLLVTPAVHAACEDAVEKGSRTYDQCMIPLMQDCVMEVRKCMSRDRNVDMCKLRHTIAGDVWILPNDKGGMTIMTPSEY